jgi:hypothetical protein
VTDKRGKPEIFNTDQGLAVHRRRVLRDFRLRVVPGIASEHEVPAVK